MRLQVRKLVSELKDLASRLKAIWDSVPGYTWQPARHRTKKQPTTFGDAQLSLRKPLMWMLVRMVLVLPIGAVGLVLCVTVIGLPLGIPIMLWVGAFCSKPLRKHPAFDTTRTMSDEAEDDWTY